MEKQFSVTINGQEIQKQDIDQWSENAALADDRVLAELLRVSPGAAVKAVLPFTFQKAVIGPGDVAHTSETAVVAPGTGAVYVAPFRAVVGSRTGANTDALKWWRDIRSGIFVGTGADAPAWKVPIAANASGNPRWDVVYAAVAIDLPAATIARKVKDPGTLQVSPQNVPPYKSTVVTIGVAQGTPDANPNKPGVPADSGGTYYIALAYVRVPDGFTAASVVSRSDVYDVSPAIALSAAMGAKVLRPADGVSSISGDRESFQPWPISGNRPGAFLPSTMQGGEDRIVPIDMNASTPSAQNGSILDSSVDWRHRYFRWSLYVSSDSTHKFASDPGVGAVPIPRAGNYSRPGAAGTYTAQGMGQSFVADGNSYGFGANTAAVARVQGADLSELGASATVGLYVDMATGYLKFYSGGSVATTSRMMFWIEATAPFGNA